MTNNPINKAIQIIGGVSKTAELFSISPAAVCKWVKSGRLPAERCIDIEKATKKQVTRYQLRPDVFGNK